MARGRRVYVRARKVPGEQGWWPESKKLETVTTYLSTGNGALTARIVNVPIDTVNKWKTQDWWLETVEKIHDEDNIELSASLKKILKKSLEAVDDRVENGEWVVNAKTGNKRRVPVTLRDVHKVASDLIDRRQMLAKTNKVETKNNESTEGRLLKLAEAFAAFVTKKPPEEKVVGEVYENDLTLPPEYLEALKYNVALQETSHAVHDPGETRLQEGIELGAHKEKEPSEG